MFEIADNRSVVVKVYGQELKVKKFEVGEIENIQEKLDSSADGERLKYISSLMVGAGVPAEMVKKMAIDDLTILFEYLLAPKKS